MSKKFTLKYCQTRTEYTKKFYMVLSEDGQPMGNPISKRSTAVAIVEWLNSVGIDEYIDPETFQYKQDLY